jgi:hypothetical protein
MCAFHRIFIGFQWVLFALQFIVQAVIPDHPPEVTIQTARNEFIVSKLIEKTPDENPITVRDYQTGGLKRMASSMEEESTKEPGAAGQDNAMNYLPCCFPSQTGHQYMKKKNYKGCEEIVTDYYPKNGINDKIVNNPMNRF